MLFLVISDVIQTNLLNQFIYILEQRKNFPMHAPPQISG